MVQIASQISKLLDLEVVVVDRDLPQSKIGFGDIPPEWYAINLNTVVFLKPNKDNILPLCIVDAHSISDIFPNILSQFEGKAMPCDFQGGVYSFEEKFPMYLDKFHFRV